jgi:hypothetical protein
MSEARFRCTECDKQWSTFALASSCHPGIGGVVDMEPMGATMDKVTEAFNRNLIESGPLGARHAAAREIARMAGDRSKVDDVIARLKQQNRRLSELPDLEPRQYVGMAINAIEEALGYLETIRQAFDNA